MRKTLTQVFRLTEGFCFWARKVVCDALAAIAQQICDAIATFTKKICDATKVVFQTICDATQTITQTICDATQTISQTICDATSTVTQTICDATSWIPFVGDLICTASHVVATVVCTASHVVSTVVCAASHVISQTICLASHLVATLVCVASHIVSVAVCIGAHIVTTIVCLAWHIVVGLVCTIVNGLLKFLLCWLTNVVVTFVRILVRGRARVPRIEHVFVLMLENRSFDHMLGFSAISGVDAATGNPTSIDGLMTVADPTTGGLMTVDTLTNTPRFNIDPNAPGVRVYPTSPADFKLSAADKDPGHEFDNVLVSLAGTGATYPDLTTGTYPAVNGSGFIANYRANGSANPTKAMNCYAQRPPQLPVLTTLAREFAVCDRWYSSLPGPTWPNRFFVHASSSGGLDDSPSGFQTVTSTLVDGYSFENGTIFDSLDWACLDWEIFEGDDLPQSFAISGMNVNALRGKFTDLEDFASRLSQASYSPRYIFIEPNYGNVLPVLTAADFTCGSSQHPLDDVTRGERLIKQVYETIRQSPHWERSLLIITYDEHGGFYDHATPPIGVSPGDAISDPANNHHNFDFKQLGVRVPAVIVSPLIPKGTIDHNAYDHSSVPATVERCFGLSPLTRRDAVANDVLHLLSLAAPRTDTPATLPNPAQSGFRCEGDA